MGKDHIEKKELEKPKCQRCGAPMEVTWERIPKNYQTSDETPDKEPEVRYSFVITKRCLNPNCKALPKITEYEEVPEDAMQLFDALQKDKIIPHFVSA